MINCKRQNTASQENANPSRLCAYIGVAILDSTKHFVFGTVRTRPSESNRDGMLANRLAVVIALLTVYLKVD